MTESTRNFGLITSDWMIGRASRLLAQWPFRSKLILMLMLSAGTALFIACTAMVATHYLNDRQSSDRRYLQVADVLASNLTASVLFNDQDAIQESLVSVGRISDVLAVAVFNARGEIVGKYNRPSGKSALDEIVTKHTKKSTEKPEINRDFVTAPILLHSGSIGTLVMRVGRSNFTTNFLASFPTAIFVFAVGLSLTYGIGMLLWAMILGPIERLIVTMQQIGTSGDFSRQLNAEQDPDFNYIAQAFNSMLREIACRNEQLSAALAEVRAARDAEQISEAKSQFMANMSHELRTPLNAIIGYSEVLKEDLSETDLPQSYEDVNWIYRSAQQLMALINSVLDFSKISAGKMMIEIQEFDPALLLADIEGILEPMSQASNNALSINIDGDVGVVRNDPTKLKQCLLNLGSNACKFTQDGTVCINAYNRGTSFVIEVVDSGEGIAPDRLASLFQPFIQGDASTTRKHGGTGLGLPITQELARLMGGDVIASSEPGCGSIFTLEIARDATNLVETNPAELDQDETDVEFADYEEKSRPAGSAVVIVDDEPSHVELLSRLARQAGRDVEVASNGIDGLQLIQQTLPSMAIIDIDMPGKNGLEMLRELRADPATQSIPIVIISVSNQRQASLELGASEHLVKPVDRADFARMLSLYSEPRQGNILIVEDDPATASLYCKSVQQIGFSCVHASNAEEALDLLATTAVSLVVTDLGLPGMDGHQLVDTMAAGSETRLIPVIVVTGRPLSREEITRLKGKVKELRYKSGLSPRMLAQVIADYTSHAAAGAPQAKE